MRSNILRTATQNDEQSWLQGWVCNSSDMSKVFLAHSLDYRVLATEIRSIRDRNKLSKRFNSLAVNGR